MSGIPSFGSIMDIFRPGAPAPVEPTAPVNAQNGSHQAADPAQMGQLPQPNPAGAAGVPNNEGLDTFKDLFSPLTPEQQAAQGNFDPNALFATMKPEAVQELVGKMNFTDAVSADQLKAISEGGEGAVQAFAAAMNSVAQRTMTQSLLASAELTKQAMARANDGLDTRLSKAARAQQVSSSLYAENPMLNNPAAKPIVDALQATISAKNPHATPQEIQEAVKDYLNKFSAATAGKPAPEAAKPGETDWTLFM